MSVFKKTLSWYSICCYGAISFVRVARAATLWSINGTRREARLEARAAPRAAVLRRPFPKLTARTELPLPILILLLDSHHNTAPLSLVLGIACILHWQVCITFCGCVQVVFMQPTCMMVNCAFRFEAKCITAPRRPSGFQVESVFSNNFFI